MDSARFIFIEKRREERRNEKLSRENRLEPILVGALRWNEP